jgi:hypothetical protein
MSLETALQKPKKLGCFKDKNELIYCNEFKGKKVE